MITEALKYIACLAAPTFYSEPDGRKYSDRQLTPVRVDPSGALRVHSLTGLLQLIPLLPNVGSGSHFIHISDHQRVAVVARGMDEWGRRHTALEAIAEPCEFQFGRWLDTEAFIIALQANFLPTPDQVTVLKLASNITAEAVRVSEDDGVSQQVTVKKRNVLKEEADVKSRVLLMPFRTFREAEQPASEFVFRVRDQDGRHVCALFEADGSHWKLDAALNVQRWLQALSSQLAVVA